MNKYKIINNSIEKEEAKNKKPIKIQYNFGSQSVNSSDEKYTLDFSFYKTGNVIKEDEDE